MSEKTKKGFKMPSSYTVLLIIIAIMAVMTWIIPAGAFVDGVYKAQPQNPQGIWDVLMAPIRAMLGTHPEEGSLIRDIVLMKLDAVGLRGARDLMPAEISGGMARRVALARAIALDPELVMYDEPFAGLDPISLGTAARLIRQLNDALGITSLVVSHDVDETFRIADRVLILANGRVAAEGTPDEVRGSADPLVRQFIRAEPDGPVHFHYPGPSAEQDYGAQA